MEYLNLIDPQTKVIRFIYFFKNESKKNITDKDKERNLEL